MRRTSIISILSALVLACASGPVPVALAKDARIVLKDGRVIAGRLRALQESRYLVQGATGDQQVVLELPESQIESVDGGHTLPAYDPRQPVRSSEAVEELDASGGVTSWFTMTSRNESRELMTRVSWGIADWELERSQHMRVLDAFGHELHPRIEMRAEGRQAIIDLAVPVAPLGTLALSVGYRDEARAEREGDHWLYSFAGDFSEDRLLSRTVLLPAGATLIAAEPQPGFTVQHEGRPLVFWRRYYAAGEALPLVVRYRLP